MTTHKATTGLIDGMKYPKAYIVYVEDRADNERLKKLLDDNGYAYDPPETDEE